MAPTTCKHCGKGHVCHTPDPVVVFEHEYNWVNDGCWYSDSPEERAISEATSASLKVADNYATWNAVYGADAILLEKMPCPGDHINVCKHIRVKFLKYEI